MTQNGRSVARRIWPICARSAAGSVHDAPSDPIPPASDTAAASAGVAAGPIGACISGTRHGSRLSVGDGTPAIVPGLYGTTTSKMSRAFLGLVQRAWL